MERTDTVDLNALKHDMSYLFFVSTYYHFLCSVLIIIENKIEDCSVIYVHNISKKMKKLCNRINRNGIEIIENLYRNRIEYYASPFIDRIRLRTHLRKNNTILISFRWNARHIFYDSKYIYDRCSQVILIEDGANSYANNVGSEIYNKIKKALGGKYDFYKDEKLKCIYVSEPDKYPEYLQGKIHLFEIFKLWNECDFQQQSKIIDCFISSAEMETLKKIKNVGIVYTQPLSEDSYVSEVEKISIFKRICEYYSQYGEVVLKPHPRDKTDYGSLGYVIINKDWPSEILTFLDIRFKFAIGICTSAVELSNAEIRFNLNNNFLFDKKLDMIPLK